jgi:hypothetical protein
MFNSKQNKFQFPVKLNFFTKTLFKSIQTFSAQEKENFYFSTSISFKPKKPIANWTRNDTYAGEDAFFVSKNKKVLGIAGSNKKILNFKTESEDGQRLELTPVNSHGSSWKIQRLLQIL